MSSPYAIDEGIVTNFNEKIMKTNLLFYIHVDFQFLDEQTNHKHIHTNNSNCEEVLLSANYYKLYFRTGEKT